MAIICGLVFFWRSKKRIEIGGAGEKPFGTIVFSLKRRRARNGLWLWGADIGMLDIVIGDNILA